MTGGQRDSSLLSVDGEDGGEIVNDRRGNFLPVGAAIGGAQDGSGAADDPADFVRRRGARRQIRDDTADLDGPSGSSAGGALNDASLSSAPDDVSTWSGNESRQMHTAGFGDTRRRVFDYG